VKHGKTNPSSKKTPASQPDWLHTAALVMKVAQEKGVEGSTACSANEEYGQLRSEVNRAIARNVNGVEKQKSHSKRAQEPNVHALPAESSDIQHPKSKNNFVWEW